MVKSGGVPPGYEEASYLADTYNDPLRSGEDGKPPPANMVLARADSHCPQVSTKL